MYDYESAKDYEEINEAENLFLEEHLDWLMLMADEIDR